MEKVPNVTFPFKCDLHSLGEKERNTENKVKTKQKNQMKIRKPIAKPCLQYHVEFAMIKCLICKRMNRTV